MSIFDLMQRFEGNLLQKQKTQQYYTQSILVND